MNDVIQIVVCGALVPAAVAFTIANLVHKFLPIDLNHRYAAALALAVAFFVGYVLLPSWAPVVPDRHWQWLPYLGMAAAILTPSSRAGGVHGGERKLVQLALALVAALLLVPTWKALEPARATSVALVCGYLFANVAITEPLVAHFPASRLLAIYSLIVLGSSPMITYHVSIKFGMLAGITGAALAGLWLSSRTLARDLKIDGGIPVIATLVAGIAYIVAINSTPVWYDLLIIPYSPAILWLFSSKKLERPGLSLVILQYVAVLAPMLFILVRMIMSTEADAY